MHLVFVGLWLGCALTETLFERALLGQGRDAEALLSRLHVRVDMLVEVPALVGAFVTGALMLAGAPWTPVLALKVALGAVAVAANIVCVGEVFRRAAHAKAGDWDGFSRADKAQHRFGAVVLAALVAALALGILGR